MNHDIKVQVTKYKDRKNYTLRFVDPVTGRYVSKSAGTHRKSEAERAAGQWEAELRSGKYKPPSRTTWEEFVEEANEHYTPGLAANTARRLTAVLNQYHGVNPHQLLSGVSTKNVMQWQTWMRNEGRSENTIKSNSATLLAAFNWAKKAGLLNSVPEFPKPRRAKHVGRETPMKGRPITPEEFASVRGAVEEVVGPERTAAYDRLLVGLWLSGLRIGEALGLSWDSEDGLKVATSDRHTMLAVPAEGEKAHQDRLLPIAPEFAAFLNNTPLKRRIGKVFPIPTHRRPPRADVVSKLVADIGRASGVIVSQKGGKTKHVSAHDLRRSFGDRWASRLMPADLQKLMRHTSIETTLRYYVSQNAESLMDRLAESAPFCDFATLFATVESEGEEKP